MNRNSNELNRSGSLMMMAQLSRRSGIPISTIKYYFREKLLPKGYKANRTTVYYSHEHLNRLREIRQLQGEGLPLGRIKFILTEQDSRESMENAPVSARRESIIEAAIPLFMKHGLEMTSITDIVKGARISRNTFYREFKSKRDVFVASLDKMLKDMIDNFNTGIRSEMAHADTGAVEAWDFLRFQSTWTEFMHLLGATIVNDPPMLNKMLDDFIELRAGQISSGLETYIEKGYMRQVDTRLLGLIILGIIDYCSRFLRSKKFTPSDRIYEKAADILINGIGRDFH